MAAEKMFVSWMTEERKKRGWSQQELAERLSECGALSIHHTGITRLERGLRGLSLDEAVAVAAAMDGDLAEIVRPCECDPPPGYACIKCGKESP